MNYITVIFLAIVCFSSIAKDTQNLSMDINQFLSSGIPNKVPSFYVFDENMKPLLFESGNNWEAGVKRALNAKIQDKSVDNYAGAFNYVKDLIENIHSADDVKYTIVFVAFDESVGNCEPCKVAELSLNSLVQHEAGIRKVGIEIVNKP